MLNSDKWHFYVELVLFRAFSSAKGPYSSVQLLERRVRFGDQSILASSVSFRLTGFIFDLSALSGKMGERKV